MMLPSVLTTGLESFLEEDVEESKCSGISGADDSGITGTMDLEVYEVEITITS